MGECYERSTQKLTVKINCKKQTKVYFRIPAWSNFAIINGEKTLNNNEYFCTLLNEGENIFTLEFDSSLRVIEPQNGTQSNPSTYILPTSLYMQGRVRLKNDTGKSLPFTTDNRARLMVGPIVLAKSKALGSCTKELFEANSIYKKNFILSATYKKFDDFRTSYKISYDDNGTEKAFYVADYAWVSNLNNEPNTFSIYF